MPRLAAMLTIFGLTACMGPQPGGDPRRTFSEAPADTSEPAPGAGKADAAGQTQVLVLHFDGITMRPGSDDPRANRSQLMDRETDLPAFDPSFYGFSAGAAGRITALVREAYAPVDIQVVQEPPATGPYTLLVVTQIAATTLYPSLLDDPEYKDGKKMVVGQSPIDCGNRNRANVAYAYASYKNETEAGLAQTIVHEAGHSFGMVHNSTRASRMHPINSGAQTWATGNTVDARCTDSGWTATTEGLPLDDLDTLTRNLGPSKDRGAVLPKTTTGLSSSKNPSIEGETVTFTAIVTGAAPTGLVRFELDGVVKEPSLVEGRAQASFLIDKAGPHEVTARYGGDSRNAASEGRLTQQVGIDRRPTTLQLAVAPQAIRPDTTIRLQAVVVGEDEIPTGEVRFFDGAVEIGKAELDVGGQALITVSTEGWAGERTLSARYGGDARNLESEAAREVVVVEKVAQQPEEEAPAEEPVPKGCAMSKTPNTTDPSALILCLAAIALQARRRRRRFRFRS